MDLRHVISSKQLTDKGFLSELFQSASELEKQDQAGSIPTYLKSKILAALFYEPSTRTRFSFETAMLKLGGQVISAESAAQFSSAAKGETLADTARVVSSYADVIAMRHPEQGSAATLSEYSTVPVINAGDGAGEHPTQALLDLYTIQKELGSLDGLNIALVGDLLYGRTVHSHLPLLSLYKIKLYLVSPPQLQLPDIYKVYLKKQQIPFEEIADLTAVAAKTDVLYVTRVQKERFATPEAYNEVKDAFIVNESLLKIMPERSIIMHPLPRVNEIAVEVDQDPRAAYFRQAKNGLYVRMALLKKLLA